jgi:K+-transporting ATPase KdpF subunit
VVTTLALDYVVGLLLSLAVLAYLAYAPLKPERF